MPGETTAPFVDDLAKTLDHVPQRELRTVRADHLLEQVDRVAEAARRDAGDLIERVVRNIELFAVRDNAQPALHVVDRDAAEVESLAT